MLGSGWHIFAVGAENLTLVADTGDFFQLIGGADPWKLLEVHVWQRGSTTLVLDTIRYHRGTAGAGGAALTEYEYGTIGGTPTVTGTSLPTSDVGTDDLIIRTGWNLLQNTQTMPIPELWIPFKASDDLGIAQESSTAHTGVGVTAWWAEYTGD